MITLLLALAAAAPAAGAARSSATAHPPSNVAPARKKAITPSPDAERVIDWIFASADNHGLPYAVVDKNNASLFLFSAKGKALGAVPVLIGVAKGDNATPGIGSKNLAEIGPAEKTTPAGRFLAKFGLAAGREKVLWVDYATSVALHPIPPGASKKEHRRERLLSPTPDDNRITFGCINAPLAFYSKTVRPLFQRKGGYVYVMPDTRPLEDVFPRLRVEALARDGARLTLDQNVVAGK